MAVVVDTDRTIDADRVVRELRRFVFAAGEEVTEVMGPAGAPVVRTDRGRYSVLPTDWLIRQDPVIDDGVLVLVRRGPHQTVYYGLLLARDGNGFLLNDTDTLRDFARYLGQGLDPVAYAQLLAALHSHTYGSGPVVYPPVIGELSADPDPVVRHEGSTLVLEFQSTVRHMDEEEGVVVDTLAWRVDADPATPARWQRQPVARAAS